MTQVIRIVDSSVITPFLIQNAQLIYLMKQY